MLLSAFLRFDASLAGRSDGPSGPDLVIAGIDLRDLRHRRVSYLGFSAARWSTERWRGLCDAFAGSGAKLTLYDAASPSTEEGERMASSVLFAKEPHRAGASAQREPVPLFVFPSQCRQLRESATRRTPVLSIEINPCFNSSLSIRYVRD